MFREGGVREQRTGNKIIVVLRVDRGDVSKVTGGHPRGWSIKARAWKWMVEHQGRQCIREKRPRKGLGLLWK
jgi:hypothetical protein